MPVNLKQLIEYKELGDLLKKKGNLLDAIINYKKVIKADKNFFSIYNQIGILYYDIGDMDKSIFYYKKLIELKPDFYEAYNNLGNSLQAVGKIKKAELSYEKSININPNFSVAYRNLSTVRKFKADDVLIGNMLSLIKKNKISHDDFTNFNFALGKAHNDIRSFNQAFKFYKDANDNHNNRIKYDILNDANLFKSIKNLFRNKINPISDLATLSNIDTPIFILGMPRSGSTLVEQIVSSHSKVYGAGELLFLDRAIRKIDWNIDLDFPKILNSISNEYYKNLSKFDKKENFITDKMPLNFRWIGFILLSMPNAKIIHTIRNPIATSWSIYKNFFIGKENGFAYNLSDIKNYYQIYMNLMNFWKKKFPDQIYDIQYEKIIQQPKIESTKVLNYIGLNFEPQCIVSNKTKRVIKTNSAYQVRQKIYSESLMEWSNYKDHLESLLKI